MTITRELILELQNHSGLPSVSAHNIGKKIARYAGIEPLTGARVSVNFSGSDLIDLGYDGVPHKIVMELTYGKREM